jgi:hypothetical protein
MKHMLRILVAVAAATPWPAPDARAQLLTDHRPDPVVEAALGYAAFLDDAAIEHALVGVAARYYLMPRLSVGPELVYMIGPGSDRDLLLTGNLMLDVLAPRAGRPRRVTPFLVAGGGWFRHSERIGPRPFTSTEGAFTLGAGVRGWTGDRVFVAVDARVGWEAHARLAANVGMRLGR